MRHQTKNDPAPYFWQANWRETARQATRRETSDAAYRDAPLSETRQRVLDLIRERPMTCDEIIETAGMTHQTASPTINYLMRRGLISDTGERRKTVSGRAAIVWGVGSGVPITNAPTRKELAERIDRALAALAIRADAEQVSDILRGNR